MWHRAAESAREGRNVRLARRWRGNPTDRQIRLYERWSDGGAALAIDVEQLPATYARAARLALDAGFTGVEVHAGHGFLLSQFLSPLFNHRTDRFGGSCTPMVTYSRTRR